jgi:hypothetical protein
MTRATRWAAGLLLVLAVGGCGGATTSQHPLTNNLDPAYGAMKVTTLAALPFASDIADDEDPDKVAASMAESKFYPALNTGTGFTILPASEVQRVLEQNQLAGDLKSFYKNWIGDQGNADDDFLKKVGALLRADAVVVGAVDVWHQQPVDLTQTGTARTTVGMLVGLYDANGKRLWLGRDENFKEALRYTPNDSNSDLARSQQRGQMERTNLRTATGVYAPPDFPPVVDAVVAPLVMAFPKRSK